MRSDERNCKFLPERREQRNVYCVLALLQIHFDTLRWAEADRKSLPLLLASLECLNCFFSVLLSFRITTLHLTGTVKYNESGWAGRGGRGAPETKNQPHFS